MYARTVIGAGAGGVIEKPVGFFPQDQHFSETFSAQGSWVLGSNCAIAGGVLYQTSATDSDATLALTGYTSGGRYLVSVTGVINYTAGTLTVDLGGADSLDVTANGSTYGIVTAGSATPTLTVW